MEAPLPARATGPRECERDMERVVTPHRDVHQSHAARPQGYPTYASRYLGNLFTKWRRRYHTSGRSHRTPGVRIYFPFVPCFLHSFCGSLSGVANAKSTSHKSSRCFQVNLLVKATLWSSCDHGRHPRPGAHTSRRGAREIKLCIAPSSPKLWLNPST
jgi:hypothetical protein